MHNDLSWTFCFFFFTCIPTDKNFELLPCLKFVGDTIMDKLKLIVKLKNLIEKIIVRIMNKIQYLQKVLTFAERFMAKIMYYPIHECQKETGFQFGVS